MNKTDFVAEIAKASGVTKADTERVLSAFEDVVIAALKAGDKVQLTGFGVFESKARAARSVRNPATGEMMDIAATSVASFKPGKRLKLGIRLGSLAVIALFSGLLYTSDWFANQGMKPDFFNQARGYRNNGSLFHFWINIKYLIVSPPEGYSRDRKSVV